MKKIFYLLIFIISIPFLLTLVVNKFYDKKIKNEIIKKTNYNPENNIEIGEMKFSLVKKFPNGTLILSDVKSQKNQKLKIKKIDVILNSYKLLKKEIEIKKIKISDANIDISEMGIQKKNKGLNQKLNINNIIFQNLYLTKETKDSSNKFKIFFPKVKILNDSLKNSFIFFSEENCEIKELVYNKQKYAVKDKINIQGEIEIKNGFNIKNGKIKTKNHSIDFEYNEKTKLFFDSKKINYTWITNMLPEKIYKKIEKLNINGEFEVKHENRLTTFRSYNTSLYYKRYKIDSLEYSIEIEDSILNCSSFEMLLFKEPLSGSFNLTNLKEEPEIDLTFKGKLNSYNINNIFPNLKVVFKNGKTYVDGRYIGNVGSKDKFINDFLKGYKKININQTATSLKPNKNSNEITNLFAQSKIIKNKFYINKSSFKIKNSDFDIKGNIEDIKPFLKNENYTLNCEIKSKNFKLKDFINEGNNKKAKSIIPEKGNFNIKTNIHKFNFNNFFARQVEGELSIKNKIIYGKDFKFNSCDGKVTSNFTLESKYKRYLFTTNSSTEKINIKNMFYQLNDFNQNNLKHNNIKGNLSSNIYLQQEWDYNFKGNYDVFYAFCDIKIEEGAMIDYAPLLALSNYIEIEELKHIEFSTLENQIEIKKKKIKIPFMEIKSSAIDIAGTGTHHFDNKIKYEFKLFLNDILSKDIKENKKINEEFGYIEYKENTGTVLYLKMTGNAKDPKITYEGIKLKDQLNNSSKKSKKEINQIFHKKIKKDTMQNKNIDYNLILEWDED